MQYLLPTIFLLVSTFFQSILLYQSSLVLTLVSIDMLELRRVSCSGCPVTEVVWETNGVEEISEGKPAPVADKVPVPPAVSKVPAER